MKNFYKNISYAMQKERPNDQVVFVLSNKFCIAKPSVETWNNGKVSYGFSDETIFGLNKNIVYSFQRLSSFNYFNKLRESMPNTERGISGILVNNRAIYRVKTQDNRKQKSTYRKLAKLLQNYNNGKYKI